MSAIPITAEKTFSRKSESSLSATHIRKRFLTWWNLWCSSLIGDLLWSTSRR